MIKYIIIKIFAFPAKYFEIKINLEYDDEIDTVGGMLFYIANKVPKNNQVFKYKNQCKKNVGGTLNLSSTTKCPNLEKPCFS